MSRVFISHSGRDSAYAVAVRQWLIERQPDLAGEIFLDIDPVTGIRSGQRWKDALRAANERCEAVVCLVSRAWLSSPECEAEYRAAEYFGKRVFCARIEAVDEPADITREWQRCDLHGEGEHIEVDIGSGHEPVRLSARGLHRLLSGLRLAGIGADHFPWPPAEDPERAPYRGWEPFEPIDAAVFFGRDGQVLRAMDVLRRMRVEATRPLFVVVGASGTGKSSFLRAGLIPRLQRNDRHFVVLDILRPQRDAISGTHGLAAVLESTRRRLVISGPSLGEIKTALAGGDVEALRRWLIEIRDTACLRLIDSGDDTAPTLVLPIDQAEELLVADAGVESAVILRLLADLLSDPTGERLSLIVALTIRTDRYQHLHARPELAHLDSVVFNDLKPMPHDHFGDIITGPARHSAHRLDIAADLVDRLRADCRDGADTLALLSLTLATLYRDYGASGRLTLDHYTRLGGIDNIVATEIDTILSRDPQTRRGELEVLRSAFIPMLATVTPESEHPLRRIARWSDLPAAALPLIDRFVERRLLVKDHRADSADGRGETVVEVALESLLRQWHPLADWLRAEAEDLRAAENLERASLEWDRDGRAGAWLLTGPRLAAAEILVRRPGFGERLAVARDYLNASRDHENARHADQLRLTRAHADALRDRARILMVLATVAALVAVVAGVFYLRASTAEQRATNLVDSSMAARLIQDAERQYATGRDARRYILEILAAHHLSPDTAEPALLDAQYRTREVTKVASLDLDHHAMAASPDGRWMVTRDDEKDREIQVWDLSTSAGPRVLGGVAATSAAVSPDGRWVAATVADTSGEDGVRIWDLRSQNPPVVRTGAGRHAHAVAVGRDGTRTVVGDDAGAVRVWDTDSVEPRTLTGTGVERVTGVAVSPDGRWVVSGDASGTARVWDLNSEAQPRILLGEPHTDTVSGVGISEDGRWAVTDTHPLRLWDLHSSLAPRTLSAAGESTPPEVHSVAIESDGRTLITSDAEGTRRVRNLGPTTGVRAVPDHSPAGGRTAISPDGRWFVTGDEAAVRAWDLESPGRQRTLTGAASAVAIGLDGHRIVTGDDTGTVRVWDPESDTEPRVLPGGDTGRVSDVAISPDGRWVVGGGAGPPRLWDMTAPGQPRLLTGGDTIDDVAVSPDGAVVLARSDGVVRVWHTNSPSESQVLTGIDIGRGDDAVMSTDGEWIVLGSRGRPTRIWHVDVPTRPRILDSPRSSPVTVVTVSPDRKWVFTGDLAGAVWMWSTDSGRARPALVAENLGAIADLTIDPRDASINVATNDIRTVFPFPVPDSKLLCAKLTTTMTAGEWNQWVTPDLPQPRLCPGFELPADSPPGVTVTAPASSTPVTPKRPSLIPSEIPNWQAVVSTTRNAAFDVPPTWEVPGPGTIFGYDLKPIQTRIALSGFAEHHRDSGCTNTPATRAGIAGSRITELGAAAADSARLWAWGMFDSEAPQSPAELTDPTPLTVNGKPAMLVTATVWRTECKDSRVGILHALALPGNRDQPVVFLVGSEQGLPGAMSEVDLRTMLMSVRPAGLSASQCRQGDVVGTWC